jgi:hypothetical protein
VRVIVAIDPGVRKCACAFFDGAELEAVMFAPFEYGWPGVSIVVVEKPQVDARTRTTTNTIVDLAYSAGVCAGAFRAPIKAVTPSTWKGSEPKPQQHARLWRVLDDAERKILGGDRTKSAVDAAVRKGALDRWGKPGASYYPRSFETHNLLDAVALGAWYLGRLEKR